MFKNLAQQELSVSLIQYFESGASNPRKTSIFHKIVFEGESQEHPYKYDYCWTKKFASFQTINCLERCKESVGSCQIHWMLEMVWMWWQITLFCYMDIWSLSRRNWRRRKMTRRIMRTICEWFECVQWSLWGIDVAKSSVLW